MSRAPIKVLECKALVQDLATRPHGTSVLTGPKIVISSTISGVRLLGRPTSSSPACLNNFDSEWIAKLEELAEIGTGHTGAQHEGAEFHFENRA